MYLERFRELVVGGSELLPITESFTKSNRRNVESELRNGLTEAIDGSTRLEDDQKETLKASLGTNPLKMREVLRKSFKDSLLELYGRAELSVNRAVLGNFIHERDNVILGNWDPSREGTRRIYYWSEYGLNLLERLIFRFFGYQGQYWDRVMETAVYFEHRDPNW
jgi:hypothetical protein